MLKNNLKIIFILIVGLFFVFNLNFQQYVFAGDYNRLTTDNQDITMNDWNDLDEDFLLRDGTNVNNDFNLLDADGVSQHKIVNLNTDSSEDNDLANVKFVNSSLSSAQGGDTYINWGRKDCGGDTIIYSGYSFGSRHSWVAGGSNHVCLDINSDWSDSSPGGDFDALRPLVTYSTDLPSGIVPKSFVQCALCYRPNSSCYIVYGTDVCSGNGFTERYHGYLGSQETTGSAGHASESQCINTSFEDPGLPAILGGARAYGAQIQNDFGVNGYFDRENDGIYNFIECAMCCN